MTTQEALHGSPSGRAGKPNHDKQHRLVRQANAFGYTWDRTLTPAERRRAKRIAEAVKALQGLSRLDAGQRAAVRFLAVATQPDWAAKRARHADPQAE